MFRGLETVGSPGCIKHTVSRGRGDIANKYFIIQVSAEKKNTEKTLGSVDLMFTGE